MMLGFAVGYVGFGFVFLTCRLVLNALLSCWFLLCICGCMLVCGWIVCCT